MPPVRILIKVGAASAAVLAVKAAAAANRLNRLVIRMEETPSLLWLYAEVFTVDAEGHYDRAGPDLAEWQKVAEANARPEPNAQERRY